MENNPLFKQLSNNQNRLYGNAACTFSESDDVSVPHYVTTGLNLVYYNGDLKSVINSVGLTGSRVIFHHINPIELQNHPQVKEDGYIEKLLLRLAADAGCYSCVAIGNTRNLPGYKISNKVSVIDVQQAKMLQLDIVQPLQTSFKHQLLSFAIDNKLEFVDCYAPKWENKNKWCGECFKCWQTKVLAYCIGKSSSFIPCHFDTNKVYEWVKEVKLTHRTKRDLTSGNYMDIIAALLETFNSIERIDDIAYLLGFRDTVENISI